MSRTITGDRNKDISAAYSELVAKRAQPIVRPVDDDYLSTSHRGVKQRERRWVKREIRRKEAAEGSWEPPAAWADAEFPELGHRR
ncbi:hypothetical protein PG994_001462 [Apiospora phragmitis]|uniref:Uncharacterized protein n=1 Tax=Apiospora phragmitis TaxID=2905665 RepID=A0ABR1WTP6_9PEZI